MLASPTAMGVSVSWFTSAMPTTPTTTIVLPTTITVAKFQAKRLTLLDQPVVVSPEGLFMRHFDPIKLTEDIPGIHNLEGTMELPDDNCYFVDSTIPDEKVLSVND